MAERGYFITLEGCEGVGKSTQIGLLKDYFEKNKIDSVFTREPGGGAVPEALRQIILDPKNKIDPITELMLYTAARREHIASVVLPSIKQNKIVVCDRFIDSTVAYQGYGRGISLQLIDYLNNVAMDNLQIDLTIFFDLPPKQGFLRKGGADKGDRLDSESIDFHQRVYNGFKDILASQKRVVAIDADKDKQTIFDSIINVLNQRGII